MNFDELVLYVNDENLNFFAVSMFENFDAFFSYMMVIGEEDQMSWFEYQIDRNLEGIKDKKRKQKMILFTGMTNWFSSI